MIRYLCILFFTLLAWEHRASAVCPPSLEFSVTQVAPASHEDGFRILRCSFKAHMKDVFFFGWFSVYHKKHLARKAGKNSDIDQLDVQGIQVQMNNGTQRKNRYDHVIRFNATKRTEEIYRCEIELNKTVQCSKELTIVYRALNTPSTPVVSPPSGHILKQPALMIILIISNLLPSIWIIVHVRERIFNLMHYDTCGSPKLNIVPLVTNALAMLGDVFIMIVSQSIKEFGSSQWPAVGIAISIAFVLLPYILHSIVTKNKAQLIPFWISTICSACTLEAMALCVINLDRKIIFLTCLIIGPCFIAHCVLLFFMLAAFLFKSDAYTLNGPHLVKSRSITELDVELANFNTIAGLKKYIQQLEDEIEIKENDDHSYLQEVNHLKLSKKIQEDKLKQMQCGLRKKQTFQNRRWDVIQKTKTNRNSISIDTITLNEWPMLMDIPDSMLHRVSHVTIIDYMNSPHVFVHTDDKRSYIQGITPCFDLTPSNATRLKEVTELEGKSITKAVFGTYPFVPFLLVLTNDGQLWSMGSNALGHCGRNGVSQTFGHINGMPQILDCSIGFFHVLALSVDKKVFAWGKNIYGQVGQHVKQTIEYPQQIFNGSDYGRPLSIATTALSSAIVTDDGKVWMWGSNYRAELGHLKPYKTTKKTHVPQLVTGIKEHIIQVECGRFHTLARSTQGHVFSWGTLCENVKGPEKDVVSPCPSKLDIEGFVESIRVVDFLNVAITTSDVYYWGIYDGRYVAVPERDQEMRRSADIGVHGRRQTTIISMKLEISQKRWKQLAGQIYQSADQVSQEVIRLRGDVHGFKGIKKEVLRIAEQENRTLKRKQDETELHYLVRSFPIDWQTFMVEVGLPKKTVTQISNWKEVDEREKTSMALMAWLDGQRIIEEMASVVNKR